MTRRRRPRAAGCRGAPGVEYRRCREPKLTHHLRRSRGRASAARARAFATVATAAIVLAAPPDNATAALLLAVTALAHGLLMHPTMRPSRPYDAAHESRWLARSLVLEGTLSWNPATGDVRALPVAALDRPVRAPSGSTSRSPTSRRRSGSSLAPDGRLRRAVHQRPARGRDRSGPARRQRRHAAGTGGTEVALLTLLRRRASSRANAEPRARSRVFLGPGPRAPDTTLALACFGGLEVLRKVT